MIITPTFIVFLILVFILVFLFISTIDKRKWLVLLVSLAICPVVYFYVFYPFINIFSSYHHQKHFNSLSWIEKPNLRYEMKNHLPDSLFIGKSKEKIEQLIGMSEWFSWEESLKKHNSNKWNYNLGIPPNAWNTTQECFELVFENNRVTQTKRYQLPLNYDE